LSFSDSSVVHPQWRPPRSVRLWLFKGTYFPNSFASLTACFSYPHVSLFILHSLIHSSTGAFVITLISDSSVYLYSITHKFHLVSKKGSKNNAKSFKIELLTTPITRIACFKNTLTSYAATLDSLVDSHLKVIYALYI
jgi:hypothetical protein